MFTVLDPVCAPTRATKYSSCVDLYAKYDMTILGGCFALIPLGVCIDHQALATRLGEKLEPFLKTHSLELKVRSSLPLKKGLIAANGVGEIDIDFKDEICLLAYNTFTTTCQIERGERIAQIKLMPHRTLWLPYPSETERSGGFGSTG